MLHLATILLAQAPSAPMNIDNLVSSLTHVGGGGAVLFLYRLAAPYFEVWSSHVKRRLGETETQAKEQTRAMITALSLSVSDIAKDQRTTAEVLRDVAKELVEFRRENEKAHETIIRGQK